jgi:hypothetical protein
MSSVSIGDRVELHSLEQAQELNQKIGRVIARCACRLIVQMEADGGWRTVKVREAKVAKVQFLDTAIVDWNAQHKEQFFIRWAREIAKNDPVFFEQTRSMCQFGNSVYTYLLWKLASNLQELKGVRAAGWAWREAPLRKVRCGVVWSDGSHEQVTPLVSTHAG